jgi:holliday junction DNA helicase RuvA
MIGYLEGRLLQKKDEEIILVANQVGYEILVPAFVMRTLETKAKDRNLSLYIYYHQTERQPKPVLIGFNLETEKEFFRQFISVGDIGPLKAVKALSIPIHEIAKAVEAKDVAALKQLKGVGERTAHKIIASLNGKLDKFLLTDETPDTKEVKISIKEDILKQVLNVLVEKLGHRPAEAKQMINKALKRNPGISTPEELFDEVYRKL